MSKPRRWSIDICEACGNQRLIRGPYCPCGAGMEECEVIEAAPVEAELERLRGLLAEAVHYLKSCGCDDEDCPGRQKAAQIREALGEPSDE